MAGAEIGLSVDATKLLRDLGEAKRRGRDMRPAFDLIGEVMQTSIVANFEAGGRPDPWAPLKAKTLLARAGGARKAKTKKGTLTKKAQRTIAGHKILIVSATLRNSIHYISSRDNVIIGSAMKYAATHQYGRGPIPARPYLVVQRDDDRDICRILRDYLTEPLR